MNINLVMVVAMVGTMLVACGVQEHAQPSAGLAAFAPHLPAAGTDAAPTSITADLSVPLQVVQGRFLGIGLGSSLADALRTLGVTPVVEQGDQPSEATTMRPCLGGGGERWLIEAAGLNLLFEGPTAGAAKLTTWRYAGGPTIGFTQMVAPRGITVGSTRRALLAAYHNAVDLGDAVEVTPPVALHFGLQGGSVAWFGDVSCRRDLTSP